MRYDIRNHVTGEVQFTAEINCGDDAADSIKIGLAVRWALSNNMNLAHANLAGAYLACVNLAGVNLDNANLSSAKLACAKFSGANLAYAKLDNAYLAGAKFSGANLAGAKLAGADLADTDLVDGGQRSDGYRFVGWVKDGVLQIRAGCHDFDITKARKHWQDKRGKTPLGDETFCILDHIEAVARIRGLIGNKGDDE